VKKKTGKKARSGYGPKKTSNRLTAELRLLEMLINKFIEKLERNGFEPKAQDALKAIQLKQKLAQTSEAEKVFWDMIDQLKSEELDCASPPGPSRPRLMHKERCDDKNR
jgi:hypothetical protein